MTNKMRKKTCLTCGDEFTEKPRDSEVQWGNREYCSMKCNNSSPKRVTSIFERLDKFTIKNESGCWDWIGASDRRGYGTLSSRVTGKGKRSPEKAHRVSYEKYFGEIPVGLFVCHKCDNPQCTNPEHLFLGTQKDNMIDCASKNRISEKSKANLIAGAPKHRGAGISKNKVN